MPMSSNSKRRASFWI